MPKRKIPDKLKEGKKLPNGATVIKSVWSTINYSVVAAYRGRYAVWNLLPTGKPEPYTKGKHFDTLEQALQYQKDDVAADKKAVKRMSSEWAKRKRAMR